MPFPRDFAPPCTHPAMVSLISCRDTAEAGSGTRRKVPAKKMKSRGTAKEKKKTFLFFFIEDMRIDESSFDSHYSTVFHFMPQRKNPPVWRGGRWWKKSGLHRNSRAWRGRVFPISRPFVQVAQILRDPLFGSMSS